MKTCNLTPGDAVKQFRAAFKTVFGREPDVTYLGNQWFRVNQELVHRRTLIEQIEHLRAIANRQRAHQRKTIASKLMDELSNLTN